MSMISEQVKELRITADNLKNTTFERKNQGTINLTIDEVLQAANTIEALSAKVSAANMERSEVYYGGRKQRSLTINIQIGKDESKSDIMQLLSEIIDETNDKGYGVMNAIVDEIQIFDYKGFSKDFFNSEE